MASIITDTKVRKPKVELSHNDFIVLLNALDEYSQKYASVRGHVGQCDHIESALSAARSAAWMSQDLDAPLKIKVSIRQWGDFTS